ncbi:MAG: helix-turn-helix domain-containing protein [Candidatus Levybacteria bacterium]|nr:helix-turn-helix domain-containing protein [Candidatus Levybacteria bacterium]
MIRVGQKFQEERIRKNLTLKEVSNATKIREEFLRAIEKGDYSSLPSPAYAHGFVRNYAKFLDMKEDEALAIFRREFDQEKAIQVLPKGLTDESEFSIRRWRIGKSLILGLVVFIALTVFLFYQYRSAIFNPHLDVVSPKDGEVIKTLSVTVQGNTDPDATVFIEEEQASINEDGSFKKTLTFFPGEVNITVRSVNRFGRESAVERNIKIRP